MSERCENAVLGLTPQITMRPDLTPPQPPSQRQCWAGLRAGALALGLSVSLTWAQTSQTPESTPAPDVSTPAVQTQSTKLGVPRPVATGSDWQRLSRVQKQALAPLASGWDTFSPAHQRKWLEVSKNFQSLSASEQGKMHARMVEWAALSPQERAQARLNFGKTAEIARELTPSEKLAKWQAYQALSAEERQKLSEGAKTRPLGAAPAVKPVPPQKLAVLPPPATAKPPTRPADGAAAAAPAESSSSN